MKNQSTNSEIALTNVSELPNLHQVEVSQRELSSEYWTPEKENEYRVGILLEVKEESYKSETTGETIQLPCVIMLSQNEDLSFSTIRNGSKRLVATIESSVETGEVVFGQTPVKITYTGKQKNKTNSFISDKWSVKPLIF
jgi:hypothetical protein